MDYVTLLIAMAFLLLAIGIGSKESGAWPILAGLGLLAGAIMARLLGGDALVSVSVELLRDTGLSMLLAAVWLGTRKLGEKALPFLWLGIGALTLSGLLAGASYVWHLAWHAQSTSLLVELGPDDTIEEVQEILGRFDAEWERAFPEVFLADSEDLAQVFMVTVSSRRDARLTAALRADMENVDHVEPNLMVTLGPIRTGEGSPAVESPVQENDPHVHEQWGLHAIEAHGAHALLMELTPQRKAVVAILDTGIEGSHEDLSTVFDGPAGEDMNGHGTHCAGLAGAVTNNGIGVASLNWEGRFLALQGYQALGDAGQGSIEQIAQAMIDATQDGVDVISMSLGAKADETPRVLDLASQFALERGVILVASAGNSDEDALTHYPSNIDGVIAVAAVDQALSKAKFSNTVGSLSRPIAAPGVGLLSTHLDGSYKPMSGTSMATPVVAGLLGVMRSLNPDLDAADAYAILHSTAAEVADSPRVGRLVNAEAAVAAVLGGPS